LNLFSFIKYFGIILTCGGLVFAFVDMNQELLAMINYYYWHQFSLWGPILIHALPNLLVGLLISITGLMVVIIGNKYYQVRKG
jgi:hypothetical protein